MPRGRSSGNKVIAGVIALVAIIGLIVFIKLVKTSKDKKAAPATAVAPAAMSAPAATSVSTGVVAADDVPTTHQMVFMKGRVVAIPTALGWNLRVYRLDSPGRSFSVTFTDIGTGQISRDCLYRTAEQLVK